MTGVGSIKVLLSLRAPKQSLKTLCDWKTFVTNLALRAILKVRNRFQMLEEEELQDMSNRSWQMQRRTICVRR